jgi:MinD superfamily P-loop ATPase
MIKIAVASGKGGTGKTFIATNIFYTLLHSNQKAILVDCDAEAPNAAAFFGTVASDSHEVTHLVPVIDTDHCTFCGKCREYCNYNAIFILPHVKIINVIEELCHGCGACGVACKFDAITEEPVSLGNINNYTINGDRTIIEARSKIGALSPVPVIKAAIRTINNNSDTAILDSPPGTSCPFIHTVSSADYIILVTEPTPFGLSDLKQSVETLRILKKSFGVIINRSGIGNNKVQEYLRDESITLLLEIPYKKETALLYSMGKLLAENDPFFNRQLLGVFERIFAKDGISDYKR